ncbi:MAG: 2Fe-2S iron-sulfur cluster-binding protein, partial [Rhodospirillales bacterium]
ITSFILRPHDKKKLPPFHPGQYLTFSLTAGDWPKPMIRCYSLSDCHQPDCYRVSIKRIDKNPAIAQSHDGRVSNHFHQKIQPGAIIDVKAPSGQFFLDITKSPPIVLIAGGVGLTPLLSMLNAVVATGSKREVWLFYGVRDGSHHIMREHLAQLALENENINLRVCYSSPRTDDVRGRDYHHHGRVTIDLLRAELPSSNYRYFICGPADMMKQATAGLKAWGVPENHINYEAFGAATVKNVASPGVVKPDRAMKIEFARSGKVLDWDYQSESLLDFAENHGILIESGCRAGNCGTCLTAVKSGDVEYVTEPGEQPESGSCLTCISVPKADLKLDA